MDRRVNHEWLPGETLIEHNQRLAAETDAYKTTVHYWLFDIDHKLRTLARWAQNRKVRECVEVCICEINKLACQDFGEDENGRKITKEEGTR